MKNKTIFNRRSIRLKGYDYSQPGRYFITICTKNRECLFGEVLNSKMILNEAGKMVEKWYYEIMNKYANIKCGVMVVMPNHFHCIIEILDFGGSPIQSVVQWFKTMTTNEYIRAVENENWRPFNKKLWQRNYYEHIIHGKRLVGKISEYIIDNPVNCLQARGRLRLTFASWLSV